MNTWSHTEKYFNGKVDILVNNAGVNPHHGWKTCLDVMIYGVMMGSYIARDKMGKTKVNTELIYDSFFNFSINFQRYTSIKIIVSNTFFLPYLRVEVEDVL